MTCADAPPGLVFVALLVLLAFFMRLAHGGGKAAGERETERRYRGHDVIIAAGSVLWKAHEYDRLRREGKIEVDEP